MKINTRYILLAALMSLASCGSSSTTATTETFTLTVSNSAGTGAGTITSDIDGINCGSDCTHDYDSGTTVVLTATPDSGSTFSGWGGDCSGTSTCTLTLSADATVTASYTSSSSSIAATSGSVATLAVGNNTVLFVPTATGISVATIESGASTSLSSELRTRNEYLTLGETVDFPLDSCAVDGVAVKLVCISYTSTNIVIFDISLYVEALLAGDIPTDTDITESIVDLANDDATASFSGGECINCGVLTDPGQGRFIVSSQDGYRVLDYTGTVLVSYLSDPTATPAVNLATENFTFDSVNKLIISPEYETSSNYIWVVNLTNGKTYRWNKRMVDESADTDEGLVGFVGVFPSGFIADAASIDSSTGVLTIADESQNGLLVLNMNTAVYDDTTNTFNASYSILAMDSVGSRLPGLAIEPTNHFLFLEEEFYTGMGVAQLPTAAADGDILVTSYNWAAIPSPSATCVDDTSWANVGDPHGLALFTGVSDGRSKGLLINDAKDCAAVIDLQSFLDTTKQVGLNEVDTSIDLVATGVITFVSLE